MSNKMFSFLAAVVCAAVFQCRFAVQRRVLPEWRLA